MVGLLIAFVVWMVAWYTTIFVLGRELAKATYKYVEFSEPNYPEGAK